MQDDIAELKRLLVKNIKRYRLAVGLTQETAAEKTDITAKYWQRLEMISQPDLPSLPMLGKIAETLGVPIWKLFH